MALNGQVMESKLVEMTIIKLNELGKRAQVIFHWVHAHQGHIGNEAVDGLAKQGAEEVRVWSKALAT